MSATPLSLEVETAEGSAIGNAPSRRTLRRARQHLLRGRYLEIGGRDEDLMVPLSRPAIRVGRGMSADVMIDDSTVSRRHALIVSRGQRTLILDDRSLNGVYVNGRRVKEAPLRDGDVVVLGSVVLRFCEVH